MKPSAVADKPPQTLHQTVHFASRDAEELLGPHLDKLGRRPAAGWERVKHNASRTVYHGRVSETEVYLKHYHSRSLAHRLLKNIGVCDSLYEMAFAQYLGSHGVRTVRPLAAACDGEVEWLATEAICPAKPADRWHAEQLAGGSDGRRAIRRALITLAQMVGRMHCAGAIHRDLHCGNVLVRTDTPEPQLVLMDLHRALRRSRLSRRARTANLAQLYHDRVLWTTRTQRLRFLKHYLLTTGATGTLRGWARLVERFASRHTHRQYAQRDRRAAGRNRYFSRVKLPGRWTGHVVLASKRKLGGSRAADAEFTLRQWRDVLRHPESLTEGDGVRVVKDSASVLVVRRQLCIGPHEIDVFIKRPRRRRPLKILVDCLRRSRPVRAFGMGHALLTRRIATALPLAALERRIGPILLDSLLITEAVDAPRLNEFLSTWLSRPPAPDPGFTAAQQRQLAQQVLWQLGRLLQSLHDNKFAHRDLKATNLLVRWSGDRVPELVLVDLDGVRTVRTITWRRRFQGLMRLNVSLLDCQAVNHAGRLRMLLGYLRRPGAGKMNFKPYWRVLERWSSRKLRQQIRSRRKRQRAKRRPAK